MVPPLKERIDGVPGGLSKHGRFEGKCYYQLCQEGRGEKEMDGVLIGLVG